MRARATVVGDRSQTRCLGAFAMRAMRGMRAVQVQRDVGPPTSGCRLDRS